MMDIAAKVLRVERAVLSRVLPFALFMAFIAVEEGLRLAVQRQWLSSLPDQAFYLLYPLKAFSVALLLYLLRSDYKELRWRELLNSSSAAAAIGAGVLIFVLWINVGVTLPLVGSSPGFNPALLPEGTARLLLTAARVAGAVLVVPVMEELFWRSFLLRYLVRADFQSVPMGAFTWASFLITTVLFGLEHHFFLAGMLAGAIFSFVLYRTRSLVQCILAHAVANLALAIHVLSTGNWYFW
ncbi:MAG: CAAX prenyl protease-related protein [Geobacter sp.]|nr:MAG: CAAX prenyl protease-related protein [Geobacter sp.]